MKCVKGMVTSFRCDVSGYPLPTVKWEFINDTYAKELKVSEKLYFFMLGIFSFKCHLSVLKYLVYIFFMNFKLTLQSIREVKSTHYKKTSFLDITDCHKGNLTCIAIEEKSKQKKAFATNKLFVYEINDGFGIYNKTENEKKWFLENDPFSLRCLASKHDFKNVTWDIEDSRDIGEENTYKTYI